MKLLFFRALSAIAAFALLIAFSPGPEIQLALAVLVATATVVLAVPWKSNIFFTVVDDLTGHGHITQTAVDGHGPPRWLFFMLTLWALVLATWSRIERTVMKLASSAGHRLAQTNTSAQPLPS